MTTLKMQAAPGGGIFLENAKAYVDRARHGGQGSEDRPAGRELGRQDQPDAGRSTPRCSRRGLLFRLRYSKSKTASLFETGLCFGWSSQEVLGWCHYGGGMELFNELMQPRPERHLLLQQPDAGTAAGLVQGRDQGCLADVGRSTGPLAAADVLLEMGMSVVQLPGGEIQPAMKSGLIDAAEHNNPTADRDFGMQDVSKDYHLHRSTSRRNSSR